MKLLIHHPVSFTATPKTFHSPPPPKPFIHHRVSLTTTPKTFRFNTHNVMIRGFPTAAGKGCSPDVVTYNRMIAESCKEKKVGEAFELLKAIIKKGMEPNLISFNEVIYGLCGKEWWTREAQEEFEKNQNRKGFSATATANDKYLVAECKNKNLSRALELLDLMHVRGLTPNESTYTSLIDSLLSHPGYCKEGFKVFNEMIVSGFEPSVVTFNRVLFLYCFYGRVEEAMGILRGMVSPDVVSYNTFISWFAENEELEKAFEMKKEMVEKGILPDAVTYEPLILGLGLCSQRRLSEAFDLFREMLRVGGLSPNEVTYTYLMTACCVEGEFSKAFHLHDEMIIKGFSLDFVREFSPTLVTYNALIYGYCSLDRVEEAVGILRGMAEMGLSPDGVSYSLVISGFCRIREMRKAYDMKKEMYDKEDINGLDEVTYTSLMEGLSDEVTYTSLLNAYLDEGELWKVAQLNDDLALYGFVTDSVSFSVYFNGLGMKTWTRKTKASLLHKIYVAYSCVPTYSIYDTLMENCSYNEFKSLVELVEGFCRRGLENAYDTMLQWNYKPDGAVYNLFILEHCKCGNVHKAYNMYMEMMHSGFASHIFSVLTLIKALSRNQMDNEATWVIQNTLRSCNLNDSELLKSLTEIDARRDEVGALLNVLAEKAIDGLLLNGGNV